jgi:hypothetical protein
MAGDQNLTASHHNGTAFSTDWLANQCSSTTVRILFWRAACLSWFCCGRCTMRCTAAVQVFEGGMSHHAGCALLLVVGRIFMRRLIVCCAGWMSEAHIHAGWAGCETHNTPDMYNTSSYLSTRAIEPSRRRWYVMTGKITPPCCQTMCNKASKLMFVRVCYGPMCGRVSVACRLDPLKPTRLQPPASAPLPRH